MEMLMVHIPMFRDKKNPQYIENNNNRGESEIAKKLRQQ